MRDQKLGSYSDELSTLQNKALECNHFRFGLTPEEKVENDKCINAPKELIAKWKKEAEAE